MIHYKRVLRAWVTSEKGYLVTTGYARYSPSKELYELTAELMRKIAYYGRGHMIHLRDITIPIHNKRIYTDAI